MEISESSPVIEWSLDKTGNTKNMDTMTYHLHAERCIFLRSEVLRNVSDSCLKYENLRLSLLYQHKGRLKVCFFVVVIFVFVFPPPR